MRNIFSTIKVLCLAAFVGISSVNAQGVIEFKKTEHDFGSFREDAGKQKFRFEFKNTGDSNITITNVSASCGCTTPAWSKDIIAPGKSGFVDAEYDPRGRGIGPFTKSLTVTSTSRKTPVVMLTIKGNAKEKEKTIADVYPRKLGDLRMVSEYLNMGRCYPGKISTQTFKIYNDSTRTLTLEQPVLPNAKWLKIEVTPTILKPKQQGEIKVTYDAGLRGDWGYQNDYFQLKYTGGFFNKPLDMYVVGTIEEEARRDLKPEEFSKYPTLEFNGGKEHDFGVIRPGEIVSHEFVFKNTGGADLLLHKTKASCGCTASEPAKKVLKPGESSSIKITFNSTGKHDGDQQQSVTIYSNDVKEPTQFITIKAKIDSKKEEMNLLAKPANIVNSNAPAKLMETKQAKPATAPSKNKATNAPKKATKATVKKTSLQK